MINSPTRFITRIDASGIPRDGNGLLFGNGNLQQKPAGGGPCGSPDFSRLQRHPTDDLSRAALQTNRRAIHVRAFPGWAARLKDARKTMEGMRQTLEKAFFGLRTGQRAASTFPRWAAVRLSSGAVR